MAKIKKEHVFLIAILSVGFILRVWGIGFGLPYQFHQDESMAINHAIAYGGGNFNPNYFQLPPLLSYILFFFYAIFYGIGSFFHFFKNTDDFLKLFLQDPSAFYLIARVSLGLLPGCISIFLIYKLTREISDKASAYLSAIFLAVSFLYVRDCHYVYHDIPLAFCLILTFIFLFQFINTNKLSKIIWTGVFAGLATGFKYNGILVIFPVLLQPWLVKKITKTPVRYVLWVNFVFFISFFVSYILSNPYSILDIKAFFESLFLEKQAHGYVGWLHHVIFSSFEGMGLLMTIISILGFIIFLFSKNIKKKLIAIFILLSYLSIVFFGQVHERYILPVLPFLLIAASVCLKSLFDKFIFKKQKIVFVIIVLLIAVPSFIKSIYSDILFSRKDTRAQAADWIFKNIPRGSLIALDHSFFSPRLIQSPEQIDEKISALQNKKEFDGRIRKAKILKGISEQEKSYNVFFLGNDSEGKFIFSSSPVLAFNLDGLIEKKIAYVVIHLDYPLQDYPESDFMAALLNKAKLIKVFNPYKVKNIDLKERFSPTAAPFSSKEIFNRNNNGPILLIYKLN